MRRLRFLEPMIATILSGHRGTDPYGLFGGAPDQRGRNRVERFSGGIDELAYADEIEMNTGDVFVIETPGGGGYGSPNC